MPSLNKFFYSFVLLLVVLCQHESLYAETNNLAVVAKRVIAVGEVIVPEDLELMHFPKSLPPNVLKDIASVEGKVARISIVAGKPLMPYQMRPVSLVRKDDDIGILYDKSNIKIRIKGKALESGTLNQVIKVRSQVGGAVLSAKVLSPVEAVVVK